MLGARAKITFTVDGQLSVLFAPILVLICDRSHFYGYLSLPLHGEGLIVAVAVGRCGGEKATPEEPDLLNIRTLHPHLEWNYTIKPQTKSCIRVGGRLAD